MSQKLQVAEVFHSLQGEGTYVGTPMMFLRLAGCNVGRPASTVQRASTSFNLQLPVLQSGRTASACATYDGRQFWCDTDYSKQFEATWEELLSGCWERHICLTGGEPLLHYKAFEELAELTRKADITVHVETSGTILREDLYGFWITCAPKIGAEVKMIEIADEVKILVDARFHPDDLPQAVRVHKNVFLCPVNEMDSVKRENFDRAYSWLQQHPSWRISWQAHKEWGYR